MSSVLPLPPPMLIPATLEDWPAVYETARANRKPDVTSGAVDLAKLIAYTRGIGPLQTADTKRVASAMVELIESNQHAQYGGRRVLLLNGPSGMGKTHAVLAAAVRDANAIWAAHGRRVDGRLVVPYIYSEVLESGRERAVIRSICEFASIPTTSRDSADDLILRFRRLAPQLYVKAVIVDDAHILRSVDRESRRLTDFLKGLITSLPVSFVFVGAGLEESALLRQSTRGGYPAAEQISRRSSVVRLATWKVDDPAWRELLANLQRQLVFPPGIRAPKLTSEQTSLFLHQRCGGLPGMAIDWVKRAAVLALQSGRALSGEMLRATVPGPIT